MKKIIILLIAVSCITACIDLELHPNDKLSSGIYWRKAEDFDMALTACYGSMRRNYYAVTTPCWDNLTGNSYGQNAGAQNGGTTPIVQGNIDPSSGGFVSGVYQGAFQDIARVNVFLSNLKDFEDLDVTVKNRYQAEARMLRAFYYSYLYRCYGSVPVVSEPLTVETQFQEKKPIEEVYKFMMDDIDFAIDNLSDVTYSESKGRWTSNAAKAYKARMLLYNAYDVSGNAIASMMAQVKELLTDITGYTLAQDFSDNFNDEMQEGSPEIMMSIKFLAPNVWTEADMWYTEGATVSPLINFIESFEMIDGTPIKPVPVLEGSNFTINTDVFTNASLADRDPRLAKTIFVKSYIVNGMEYSLRNPPVGTGLSKFISQNLIAPFDYSTRSQQDWVVLRYADVLLMLAEAENELNGATLLAYSSVNTVRNRTSIEMPDLPQGMTKEEMRKRIRNERRVELAFEGQHYFDLKRWRIANSVLNAVDDAPITYNFQDKHNLWPIPQGEIDKNQGVVIQNPDYK